jgi:hypothetical protein
MFTLGILTPKLIAGLVKVVILKREAASCLGHDVGMIDVEEKDEATASLHAQGPKLAKSRQGLVRTRHSLVLLSGLRISHVAEDRSILCHLLERSIILVELFLSPALTGLGSARFPRPAGASRPLRNGVHGLVVPLKVQAVSLCRRVRFVAGFLGLLYRNGRSRVLRESRRKTSRVAKYPRQHHHPREATCPSAARTAHGIWEDGNLSMSNPACAPLTLPSCHLILDTKARVKAPQSVATTRQLYHFCHCCYYQPHAPQYRDLPSICLQGSGTSLEQK